MNIYVGGLSPEVTEEDLQRAFEALQAVAVLETTEGKAESEKARGVVADLAEQG